MVMEKMMDLDIKEETRTTKTRKNLSWKHVSEHQLNVDYSHNFLTQSEGWRYFQRLEQEIVYFNGDLAKVRVFGKLHDIPRQQAAYGLDGLSYKYSGISVPSKPWTPALYELKQRLESVVLCEYNFVLINRYRNGNDHMGEHRDDESCLDKNTAIASVSLGQNRDFIFKHGESRKTVIGSDKKGSKKKIPPIKMNLGHGSLLLMKAPTNKYWYHSLPQRKALAGVRINLTFRKIVS